jgi:SPP1 family predicted phage head-tail adaptor
MFFRETVDLVSITQTTNAIGDFVDTETTSTVFADKQSIRQSEFYQAYATGLRPEIMFVIRQIDYSNQPRLKWNNKYYNIIRTFDKDGELVELICEGIVGTESR